MRSGKGFNLRILEIHERAMDNHLRVTKYPCLIEKFMKELRLSYLATFFIVALFLSTVPSGLSDASLQDVLARDIITEGAWHKNSSQTLNQVYKHQLSRQVFLT